MMTDAMMSALVMLPGYAPVRSCCSASTMLATKNHEAGGELSARMLGFQIASL
jgi:hypothetical protein